ncbi:MAG: hypothetical protein J1F01_02010 [Oscillospiraceae bacterium]|nr:hypothetical protein [Oscillospiraceae bacterium]
MIYSQDIRKICALCTRAHTHSDDEMYCEIKKQPVPVNGEGCKKFSYDIMKRTVRRAKKLKTDFKPEDFAL